MSDHYARIIAAMRPGLLVAVNQTTPSPIETGELEVASVRSDCPAADTVRSDGCQIRLSINFEGDPVFQDVDEDGHAGREYEIETIEILGIRGGRGGESA